MKELISVKERHERYLLGKRNVTGIGIGFKKVKGRKTNELSIIVLVEKKLPETALRDEDIIEKELDGVPTDVQEVGKVKALVQECGLGRIATFSDQLVLSALSQGVH